SLFKTVLDTPQTQEIRQDLRWLQSHLGPARDAEVFVREILDPVTPVFAEVPGFSELRQQFIARQQGLLEMARALPEQPRFTQTLLSLSRWAEGGDWLRQANQPSNISNNQTVSDFARTALTKRDRQIGKAMLRLDKMAESERHELRIKIKKLRYSIDFFGSIFHANRAKRSSVALGLVQDRLGLLNDIAVARQILQRQADENGTVQSSWVAGMIAGWHSAQTKELLRQAALDWKGYARLPRFWTED
ncbi:MAG TPA: CHAD domain-containing protein, partial [Rhodospirillaceae bacterium]|nr:CHAD domain-containing protein [Rhodospirillaceae bacterium]